MRYLILLLFNFFIGCAGTKYVTVPLSEPPKIYKPNIIYTEKDFLNEYKRSLMKISEWQNWYNIQVNTTNNNYKK